MSEIEQFSNSKVIVAGNHYLCMYHNSRKIMLHNEGGVYYGISWSKYHLFVLWRNHKKGEIILVYDQEYKLVDEIQLHKFLDGHQILYARDSLFVTNTAENSLLEINLNSRKIEEIPVPPHGADHNHINGLSYIDAHHMYILLANGKIPEKSEIRKYNMDRQEFVGSFRIGDQIHNYLDTYITSSYDFQVFDYRNGEIVNSVRLEGGWLRGLDLLDNLILVGSSPISDREERSEAKDAKIYSLNRNLEVLEECIIPEIGQINEIRTVSPSFSHNKLIFSVAEKGDF